MRSKVCAQMGRRIRSLRKQLGYTQGELARRSEISRQSLVLIEAGCRDLGITALARIARGLGMSLSELMDGIR